MTKLVDRSIIILGLLLCSFALLAQNSKYYNRDGKFKIQFPVTPEVQSQVQKTDMGDVTVYMFISTTDQGAAFLVSYVDYPASQLSSQDNKALLDRAKNGFVQNLHLTVSDSMYMNYSKYQGIMFHGKSDAWYCSMRDYLVENRLYQLGILQAGAIKDQEENDFFDSFELVK